MKGYGSWCTSLQSVEQVFAFVRICTISLLNAFRNRIFFRSVVRCGQRSKFPAVLPAQPVPVAAIDGAFASSACDDCGVGGDCVWALVRPPSFFSDSTIHPKSFTRKGANLPPRGKNTHKEEDVYT